MNETINVGDLVYVIGLSDKPLTVEQNTNPNELPLKASTQIAYVDFTPTGCAYGAGGGKAKWKRVYLATPENHKELIRKFGSLL